jgi:hypothetical protein
MFGTTATMPFVHSPPRFGSRDIGPIIPWVVLDAWTLATLTARVESLTPEISRLSIFSEAARLSVGIDPEIWRYLLLRSS